MNLSDLIKDIKIEKIIGSPDIKITGITVNSNDVKPGYVFICIVGFNSDGHNFAADAVESGAVAIVCQHEIKDIDATMLIVKDTRSASSFIASAFYDYPCTKFKLIGVTGTNGKTTTTYIVKSILESQGKRVGLIGTNQNMICDEVLPAHRTTPDTVELMELFARIAKENVDYVIMEVSSHSLVLNRVAACDFEVGAFTNITQDHLDFHKTMEKYLEAKAILFNMCKKGVINTDDEFAASYLMENQKCNSVISYGVNKSAELMAKNISLGADGVEFDISYGGKEVETKLAIPGMFSVYNALTAIGCCLSLGFSTKQIAEGLKSASGVKGRIEVVPTGKDYTVIIDYAHTPDGLLNIINTIRDFAKARIITLFGCGGDRDKTKRPIMGKIAADLSDFCVVTSDNPRTENPSEIIKDVLVGVKQGKCDYEVVENRFEAIEYALDHAQKDDIILLAGKGHETYQILNDRTIVFDEREIVMKLIDSPALRSEE